MSFRHNVARWFAVMAGVTLVNTAAQAQAQAGAADASADAKINEAMNTHFLSTDFDRAESTLRQTLKDCADKCTPNTQARIWMYIGVVLLSGKNNVDGARSAFAEAAKLDPSLPLDDDVATPEGRALYQEVGGGSAPAKKEEPAAPPPKPTAEPKPPEEEEEDTSAPGFGRKGQVVVGVQRLVGFHSWTITVTPAPDPAAPPPPGSAPLEEKYSGVNYALLGSGDAIPNARAGRDALALPDDFDETVFPIAPPHVNPFASAGVAFDYFVANGVSLGGALSYAGAGAELLESPFKSRYNALAVFVRLGYAYMFTPEVGVWPQLGGALASTSAATDMAIIDPNTQTTTTATGRVSYSFQNASIALPLIVVPVEHFGFILGPLADVGIGGSRTIRFADGVELKADAKITNMGVAGGIFGYL